MEAFPMSHTEDGRDEGEVGRLLAGAAKTVTDVRYCWLVTERETGGANARPMGRLLPEIDENDWTIRFITDGRSRKTSEIRRAGNVALVFQHDRDDAFVVLSGGATLIESPAVVRQLWTNAYNAYFPGEADRPSATFIQVNVDRMELWIRGVTQEPFGLRPTVLERDAAGTWRSIPGDRKAPA
jgi:general stress protein 26